MAKLTHISQPPGHEHEQHPGNTVLYKIHHPEIPDCGVELHAWQRTLPGHYSPTAEDKRVYPSIPGEEKEIRWCTRFPRSGNNPEPNRPIMEHGPYCYLCTRLNETSIDRIVETKRLPFCHRCKQELERRFPSGYRSCKCAVEWKLNCCTACMRTEVRHEYNRLAFPDGRVIAKRWRRAFGEVRMMRPKYLTDRQRCKYFLFPFFSLIISFLTPISLLTPLHLFHDFNTDMPFPHQQQTKDSVHAGPSYTK